jgi:hypothetical protein
MFNKKSHNDEENIEDIEREILNMEYFEPSSDDIHHQ